MMSYTVSVYTFRNAAYLLLIREWQREIISYNHQLIICAYIILADYVAIMRKQVKHNMNY